MAKLNVKQLKKSYGQLEVLKGVDVEIQEGEVVCVIGPSGSGKSTFLRCLNKLEEITAGNVIIDGKDLTDTKVNLNKVRESIGMVFQHFNLFPNLTVLDNITLAPIELKKMTKSEAKENGLKLLERVGLSDKANVYPQHYQGDKSTVLQLPVL